MNLYLRPALVEKLMGQSGAHFSRNWAWLLTDSECSQNSAEFPLSPLELIAINDLFNCTFQGAVRRNYMNAKAVELFALAMHHLSDSEAGEREVTLSRQDRQRITNAHAILIHEMSEQLTLDQLARRVGVNRSKLAKGFKSIYGASVQAYWRNLRLCRARELLTIERMSVTDVATAVGYADISCLTRAFERRFGILPKDCRSSLFNKRCVDN